MQLTPIITVHISAAVGALLLGPVALWARRSRAQHPRLHRAFGYAWVTLMVATAVSALFIRGSDLAVLAGFSLGDLVWDQWLGLISPGGVPPRANPMVAQILSNTPWWVWGLLVALLALGFSQARSRRVGLARIALLPLGLGAFSLYGTVSAFGASPAVLGGWLMATLLALIVITQMPPPAGVRYDAATRQFQLPGSWVPMALIMGIFLTRYMVGATLAMNPALSGDTDFTLVIAMLYGVFSGVFAGRTVRLLGLALRHGVPTTPALAT